MYNDFYSKQILEKLVSKIAIRAKVEPKGRVIFLYREKIITSKNWNKITYMHVQDSPLNCSSHPPPLRWYIYAGGGGVLLVYTIKGSHYRALTGLR